jgi:hypothetical protein
MTYCMFENTTREMDQILNTLDEAFEEGRQLKLSADEKLAYEQLIHQCQRFLKLDELMTGQDEEVDLSDSCYGYIDADDLV